MSGVPWLRNIYVAIASRPFQLSVPRALRQMRGAGRFLLLTILAVCAVTPFTESMWSFDGFAHGGSDMELGVMSFVAVLCLALVLLRQCRARLRRLLAMRTGAAAVPIVRLLQWQGCDLFAPSAPLAPPALALRI